MKKCLCVLLLLALAVSAPAYAEEALFDAARLINWTDAAIEEAYGVSASDFRPSNPQPLTYIATIEPVIDPLTGQESEGGYAGYHRVYPVSTQDAFEKGADLSALSFTLTDDPNLAAFRASITYEYVADGDFKYKSKDARIPMYTGILTVTLTDLLTGERAEASRKCYCFTEQSIRTSVLDEGIGKQFYGGPGKLQKEDASAFADLLGMGAAGDFNYRTDAAGGVCLTGWHGEAAETLAVPAELDGKAVTGIGEAALTAAKATVVSLPDTLTHIDNKAFYENGQLTAVNIPASVTSIGESAFAHSGLASIALPDGLTTLGDAAFYNCTDLKQIGLPAGLTKIPEYAFCDCAISTIELPETVTEIGHSAFYGCASLEALTLPKGLEIIGPYAFKDCESLKSLSLPAGLTEIGYGAFPETLALTVVEGTYAEKWAKEAGMKYVAVPLGL